MLLGFLGLFGGPFCVGGQDLATRHRAALSPSCKDLRDDKQCAENTCSIDKRKGSRSSTIVLVVGLPVFLQPEGGEVNGTRFNRRLPLIRIYSSIDFMM